ATPIEMVCPELMDCPPARAHCPCRPTRRQNACRAGICPRVRREPLQYVGPSQNEIHIHFREGSADALFCPNAEAPSYCNPVGASGFWLHSYHHPPDGR